MLLTMLLMAVCMLAQVWWHKSKEILGEISWLLVSILLTVPISTLMVSFMVFERIASSLAKNLPDYTEFWATVLTEQQLPDDPRASEHFTFVAKNMQGLIGYCQDVILSANRSQDSLLNHYKHEDIASCNSLFFMLMISATVVQILASWLISLCLT